MDAPKTHLRQFVSPPVESKWPTMYEGHYGHHASDYRECLRAVLNDAETRDTTMSILRQANTSLQAIGTGLGLEKDADSAAKRINRDYLEVQRKSLPATLSADVEALVQACRRVHRSATAWAIAIEEHYSTPVITGTREPEHLASPSIISLSHVRDRTA